MTDSRRPSATITSSLEAQKEAAFILVAGGCLDQVLALEARDLLRRAIDAAYAVDVAPLVAENKRLRSVREWLDENTNTSRADAGRVPKLLTAYKWLDLVEALLPFAAYADMFTYGDIYGDEAKVSVPGVRVGDLRRARAVLARLERPAGAP